MLGAALVFVTLFRRLGLGATLGYIVAGALIGPHVLGPGRRPRAADQRRRNRHRAAAVHRRARASAEPAVAAAQGHFRARAGAGRAVRPGAQPCFIYLALGMSPEAALAIGLPLALSSTAQVLPMLRADNELNTPQGERAFSILLFQDLSIVPLITIIAAMSRVAARSQRAGRLEAGALHGAGAIVGLVARRALRAQSAVPADRPARRARAVRRRRPVHGDRRRPR